MSRYVCGALLVGLLGCGTGATGDPDASPIVIDARVRDAGRDAGRDGSLIDGSTLGPNCGLDYHAPTVPVGHACTGVTLAPGVGLDRYLAVADGDTVELYRGPQGGLMFLLGMRATGFDATAVTLCAETQNATGSRLGIDCWHGSLSPVASAAGHECAGLMAQTEPPTWSAPERILDHDVTVRWTLTDALGCQSAALRTLHVAPTIAATP